MEKQIQKLKAFYKCSYLKLAEKIEITERHLQNVRKGKNTSKHLEKYIDNMVKTIESL